jgi:hypothetical protein
MPATPTPPQSAEEIAQVKRNQMFLVAFIAVALFIWLLPGGDSGGSSSSSRPTEVRYSAEESLALRVVALNNDASDRVRGQAIVAWDRSC